QGPLIDEAAVAKVREHIADAVAQGGRILTGGRPHALGHTFFEPTVLADALPTMRLAREETFGPLAPLFRFGSDADVIRMANDTEYGLAAYFYSRDIGRAWGGGAGIRHGGHQHRADLQRGRAFRRGQAVRAGARGLPLRARRLPGRQIPVHGRHLIT